VPSRARPKPADSICSTIQFWNTARAGIESPTRCRLRRKQGKQIARPAKYQCAGCHNQSERHAIGWTTTLYQFRRHSMDGEPCRLQLQLAAGPTGEEILIGFVRPSELYMGKDADDWSRSFIHEPRRARY